MLVACRPPARGTVLSGAEGAVIATLLERTSCGAPMSSYKRIYMSGGRELYAVNACGKNRRFACSGEVTGCSGIGLSSNPIDITCCVDGDERPGQRPVLCLARTEPMGELRVVPRSDVPDLCPGI